VFHDRDLERGAPVTSLWWDTLPVDMVGPPRTALPGDISCDVCIVGGGYTGLWTAHTLARLDPGLRIVVVEHEVCGFGASGRNGGWCSSFLPMSLDAIAHQTSRDDAIRLQREMFATVDHVVTTASEEGIDAHVAKGGTIKLARTPGQVQRLRNEVTDARAWGFGEDDVSWLDAADATARVRATDVMGAMVSPHCAALHPALLVRGLASAVERAGVAVHERTRAIELHPGRVVTDHGLVRTDAILRCTEGFTARLRSERRTLVPLYSLMVATEPIGDELWARIGWSQRETLSDGRQLIVYAQRTADGRIAFGGRGAPYHFGSAISPRFDVDPEVHGALEREIRTMFPVLRDVAITHRWGGPLGVPRDWHASVRFDRATGLGSAGGYVGDGVALSNLAGRALAHLVCGTGHDITTLPIVGHRSRQWEPEPLRWLGINAGLRLPAVLDRTEADGSRAPAPLTWLLGKLVPH
jgi:glycine/D-amino acid oxidase-like deaminating enzyme